MSAREVLHRSGFIRLCSVLVLLLIAAPAFFALYAIARLLLWAYG